MRWAPRLILVALAMAMAAGPVLAAPEGADRAAEQGLAAFKMSEAPGWWGLTAEELQSLTLSEGYQMVGFTGPDNAPATERVGPFGWDHYLYFLSAGGRTVLSMRVVKMPDGWQAVAFGKTSEETGTSLSKAQELLRGSGLSQATNPRVFFFRGEQLWLLDSGDQSFVFPVAGTRVSEELRALGVSGAELAPAVVVLERLASLPPPPEDGSGGGIGLNWMWQSGALVLLPLSAVSAAALFLVLRKRRQPRRPAG